MNQGVVQLLSMLLGCGAILLLAGLVILPLRRQRRRPRPAGGGEAPPVTGISGRIFYPLAVLALSWPIFFLLRLCLPLPQEFLLYRKAWLFFWAALLVLNLVETVALFSFSSRGKDFPVPGLLRNIIRVVVLLGIIFWVLRVVLRVDISPLLASTALITAVVGFALQGVLGNLLAGMSIHLTRSVVPGDWVAIGESEGKVVKTNWRETRLRTVGGHTILIPNAEVASSQVRNLSIPTSLRRHEINVGASYSDAPGEVIAALNKAAGAVDEVLAKPQPSAFVTEFQDYGINYVLRFWSNRYQDRVPIEGNVCRMIWYEFKRRGIEIPFPMSDKLLNDFMAVVYRQRLMPPEEEDLARVVRDLRASDLVNAFLVDGEGKPALGETEVTALAPLLVREKYTEGEVLFRQGEPGDWCLILVKGDLLGRVEFEGAKASREFELGPGALVGEMSLITGLPRTATITARGETEILRFGQEAFRCLLALDGKFPELLARLVEERQADNLAQAEGLKKIDGGEVKAAFQRENIFRRFSRLLNRRVL